MAENYFYSSLTGQQIEDTLLGAVRGDSPQNKSTAWKEQARRNIGAGEQSSYFTIKGYVTSTDQLPQTPAPGDAYGVGSAAPYDIYVYDGLHAEWVNNGPFNTGDFIDDGSVSATKGWSSQKINSEIDNAMFRPNLIRNAYFVGGGSQQGHGQLPVNQRGQTVYTSNSYSISGWILTRGTVNVKPDCVQFVSNSDAAYKRFRLLLDAPLEAGQTYTLSLLCKKNSGAAYMRLLYGSQSVMSGGSKEIPANSGVQLVTNTVTVPSGQDYENGVEILVGNASSSTVDIDMYAWKLEPGNISTLAHLENGSLVLNEIPNYQEELFKCRTSVADSMDEWANFPVEGYSPVKRIESSNYSIVASDAGKTLYTDTANVTVTLSAAVANAMPIGTEIALLTTNSSSGLQVAFGSGLNGRYNDGGTGRAVTAVVVNGSWNMVALKKISSSYWLIQGDVEVVS